MFLYTEKYIYYFISIIILILIIIIGSLLFILTAFLHQADEVHKFWFNLCNVRQQSLPFFMRSRTLEM
jgi:hypothetical protein